jgi:hypothetical protein
MARAVFAVGLLLALRASAWGQAAPSRPEITQTPTSPADSKSGKFAGSLVEASTYVGSGTFYAGGYTNPYAALALFFRPTYALGTRFQLSANARIFLTTELTAPDNPNAQRFYPYDPWFWLAAKNLHTFERPKLRIGGTLRTILPLSPESRYSNLVAGIGGGPSLNRHFEFGGGGDPARQWTLDVSWGVIFTKYFHTSDFRGTGPGDTTGCRGPSSVPVGGASAGSSPSASDSDRCGGPANTNFAIQNAFVTSLARGPWSLGVTLFIINGFKYSFPEDSLTADPAVSRGQTDQTWGIVSLGYKISSRLNASVGLSSLQPALDSRYRYPRFPFYDFSGGASTQNHTSMFLSVGGTL